MNAYARNPLPWIVTTLLLVVVCIVLVLYAVRLNQENTALVHAAQERDRELDQLRNQIGAVDTPAAPAPPLTGFLTQSEIEQLRRRGLDDPINDLRQDLMSNPELIPHEGVLGGTMSFYVEDQIHIVSPQWAVAYFEDGHIAGRALLEYEVTPEGGITWRVLDTETM